MVLIFYPIILSLICWLGLVGPYVANGSPPVETTIDVLNTDLIVTVLKNLPNYSDLERLRRTNRRLKQAVDVYAPGIRYHGLLRRECKYDYEIVIKQLLQNIGQFPDLRYPLPLNRLSVECVQAIGLAFRAYHYNDPTVNADFKISLRPLMEVTIKSSQDFSKLQYLEGCNVLFQIVLSGNDNLADGSMYTFTSSLNVTGIELHISNYIRRDDALVLYEMLTRPGNEINYLNLNYNSMSKQAYRTILSAFSNSNNQVRRLHMIRIRLIDEVVHEGFDRELGDYGARHLSKILKNPNNKIQVLLLNSNVITHEGAISLASALGDANCKLQDLDLGTNKISNAGAIAITEAICQNENSQLRILMLVNNRISSIGVTALMKLLVWPNSRIQNLDLLRNEIDDSAVTAIVWAIRSIPDDFEHLNLSVDGLSSDKRTKMWHVTRTLRIGHKFRFHMQH